MTSEADEIGSYYGYGSDSDAPDSDSDEIGGNYDSDSDEIGGDYAYGRRSLSEVDELADSTAHSSRQRRLTTSPTPSPVFSVPQEFELDGSTCYYAAEGAASDLPLDQDHYTIAAWIKPDSDSDLFSGIVGWGNYGTAGGTVALRTHYGMSELVLYWFYSDLNAALSIDLADGDWHFVATTWDGTTRKTFVDDTSTPVGTDTATRIDGLLTDKSTFCVGRTNYGGFFKGSMKGVAIYKSALDESALAQLKAEAEGLTMDLVGRGSQVYSDDMRRTAHGSIGAVLPQRSDTRLHAHTHNVAKQSTIGIVCPGH